jgi:hypothetical protein
MDIRWISKSVGAVVRCFSYADILSSQGVFEGHFCIAQGILEQVERLLNFFIETLLTNSIQARGCRSRIMVCHTCHPSILISNEFASIAL